MKNFFSGHCNGILRFVLVFIDYFGTRTFNSPLNLNRTKRFLFLMFSSNAILTTLFPLPSTERKRSLVSTLNGILSHLGNTRLTSSAHLVCEFVHHPVCYSLLWMTSRGICHAMGTRSHGILFLIPDIANR